jgi:hypothetical protein
MAGAPFTSSIDGSSPHTELRHETDEESRHRIRADHRAYCRRGLRTAIRRRDDIRGEHLTQSIDVAVLEGAEESLDEPMPLVGSRSEALFLCCDALLRAMQELPRRRGGDADEIGDLVVVVIEHFVEQEHRPLLRREPLERPEQCKLHVLIARRARVWIAVDSGQHRLGQPRTDVLLALHLRRFQSIESEAREDRDEERLHVAHDVAVAVCDLSVDRREAHISVLHEILRIGRTTGHPVGDGEAECAIVFEIGRHAACSSFSQL